MPADVPFNPLDRSALAENVAAHLEARELMPLPPQAFTGAGIYAIYFVGSEGLYGPLTATGRPLYVGKAVPAGGRIGGFDLAASAGNVLWRRLAEHGESIEQATNLELSEFRCRYLVVEDIWIPLGEQLLISRHNPVWNSLVAGFGNHDPGANRYAGKKPLWDELHPGRPWADRMQRPADKTATQLTSEIEEQLASYRGPRDGSDVLEAVEEGYEPPALGELVQLDGD